MILFARMTDYLPGFKVCMDAGEDNLNELCKRYYGFHLFTQVLEELAGDIESGAVVVPK